MRLVAFLLLATVLASALLAAFPAIDLATAALFYNGTTFPIAAIRPVEALRMTLYIGEQLAFLVVLALALLNRPFLNLSPREWLYQLLIFLCGPGIIVNGILKRIWGRARPFQTTEFGGTQNFTRAWEINPGGSGNSSFVSGEMAGATALAICLLLILRANQQRLGTVRYRLGIAATLSLPLITAWQRMAAGRHFLSDVVIAALLIGLLAAVLRFSLFRNRLKRPA